MMTVMTIIVCDWVVKLIFKVLRRYGKLLCFVPTMYRYRLNPKHSYLVLTLIILVSIYLHTNRYLHIECILIVVPTIKKSSYLIRIQAMTD